MEKDSMRIIIAPQSLKGSLTAAEAGQAIALGVQAVYPDAEIDIVPIADGGEGTVQALVDATGGEIVQQTVTGPLGEDRKSTRLNSSHLVISYAVFCLKKKKKK